MSDLAPHTRLRAAVTSAMLVASTHDDTQCPQPIGAEDQLAAACGTARRTGTLCRARDFISTSGTRTTNQPGVGVTVGVNKRLESVLRIRSRSSGAEEGTRTLTRLPSLAPQASVSTNSTTSARRPARAPGAHAAQPFYRRTVTATLATDGRRRRVRPMPLPRLWHAEHGS
jgi:hypothetical protein